MPADTDILSQLKSILHLENFDTQNSIHHPEQYDNSINQIIDSSSSQIPTIVPNHINQKKRRRQNNDPTPSNLTTSPLQSLFNPLSKLTASSDPDTDQDIGLDQSESTNVGKEGFDNKWCRSIGEFLAPIFKYMDFLVYWFVDKCMLEYPTVFINFWAQTIYEFGGDKKENCSNKPSSDELLIRDQIKKFLALVISCFIVYNWYFVMCFKQIGERVPLIEVSTYSFTARHKLLGFLLKYLVIPLSLVNTIMTKYIPNWIYSYSDATKFTLIFLFTVFVTINYGAGFASALSSSMKRSMDTKKNPYIGTVISLMVLYGVFSIFLKEVSVGDLVWNGLEGPSGKLIMEILTLVTSGPFGLIGTFLMFLVRITVSIAFSWFACLLMMGYILLMSFYSIGIYSKSSISTTIQSINKSIVDTTCDTKDPALCYTDECYPENWFARLMKMVEWIIKHSFQYFFEIVFIMFFIQGLLKYSVQIQDGNLKSSMLIMASIGIFIIGVLMWFKYMDSVNNPIINAACPPKPSQEDIISSWFTGEAASAEAAVAGAAAAAGEAAVAGAAGAAPANLASVATGLPSGTKLPVQPSV